MDSKQWYSRHLKDAYVNKAQADGFRSRAAYKLLEIDDKLNIFRGARCVIDLGSAPGSWAQVAIQKCSRDCRIIALDLLAMKPLVGVDCIQGDLLDLKVRDQLTSLLKSAKADVVLSDMAPNMTGISAVDQLASAALTEMAIDSCQQWLAPSGIFVVKTFHGSEFQQVLNILRKNFIQVKTVKPKASRSSSKEVFLYAKGLESG